MAATVARYGSTGGNVTLTISNDQSPKSTYRPLGSQSSNTNNADFQLLQRPGYRFKSNQRAMEESLMVDGPGRRLRKNVANVRRHVDYIATILNHAEARLWQHGRRERLYQQPDVLYQNAPLPPSSTPDVPVDCILTKFVRAAMNKVKCPVYSLCWTPEGKRLVTGASTGEFTLWNGTAFNFETILQAHDTAIRAMTWSYNEDWLISGDHDGFIKYWQPNMNNVHMYQAHKDEPVRGLSFAPTDVKLASASDDGTARIWDFARCTEERVLRGHGSEVRTVKWHPQKGLLVTGSRDSQQPVKLWDPKTSQCLATLQDHKSSVLAVEWNQNGNWLLTASRDHLIKLYDIRVMREIHTYRGHKKEVTALAWHPTHEGLFVSGGGDGSLAYWLADQEKEVGLLEHAHDQAVWALEFHPLGHILASGSNDNNTKFWARNRPGDTQDDIFGLASFSNIIGALDKEAKSAAMQSLAAAQAAAERKSDQADDAPRAPIIPGMGLDEEVVTAMRKEVDVTRSSHGGGGLLELPEDLNTRHQNPNIGAKRTLIKQPPAKRAQRQFERMWNVSKPGGGDEAEDLPPEEEVVGFKRQKTSLLGPPPALPTPAPSMLSPAMPRDQQGTSSGMGYGMHRPPGPPPPSMPLHPPPAMRSPGGTLQWPPGMVPPTQPAASMLPATTAGHNQPRSYKQEDTWMSRVGQPSTNPVGGDVDYRQQSAVSSASVTPATDVDLRVPHSNPPAAAWNPVASQSQQLNDPRARTNTLTSNPHQHRKPQISSSVQGGPGVPMLPPLPMPPGYPPPPPPTSSQSSTGAAAEVSGEYAEDVRDPRRRVLNQGSSGGPSAPTTWEPTTQKQQGQASSGYQKGGGGYGGGGDFDGRRGNYRGGPRGGFGSGPMRGRGRGRGRAREGPY